MAAIDHLSPRVAFFRDTNRSDYDDAVTDHYEVSANFEEKWGSGDSVISAAVRHAPGYSATTIPKEHDADFSTWASQHERRLGQKPPPNGRDQGRLFLHRSELPFHEVESLYADKSSRALTVPLLGVIQNRARAMTGQDAVPSSSLSSHSSRLVRHLADVGAFAGQVRGGTNGLSWRDSSRIENTHPTGNEISKQELRQGRSTGRSLARRPREPKPMDQGALF